MASDEISSTQVGQGASPLERLASFRFTYVAIFLFILLSVSSLVMAQSLLQSHFQALVVEAATPELERSDWVEGVQRRVADTLESSRWIRVGGVRVLAIVLAADARTLVYPARPFLSDVPWLHSEPAEIEVPLGVNVDVALPINSLLASGILVTYFAVLVTTLVVYTRRLTRGEEKRLDAVIAAREEAAGRAAGIEEELAVVWDRLNEVEPEHEIQSGEIRELENERRELLARLANVEEREASLRESAVQSGTLQQEQEALEELLDEAMSDLQQKEQEIETLQREVKRAARGPSSSRSREADQLGRRLRTLYKNAEIEDRAVQDLVALRDGTMQLKAEEALKRLSDEPETAAVRRKVGGLPPHLSIFELGFAGKGRIYYTRGRQRRYRILSVGAKNTQKTDLEYLSRLPRE